MRVCPAGALIFFVCQGLSSAQPVRYVDSRAVGSGSGSNWANAFPNLTHALDAALPGDRIWVAAGTYHPGHMRSDSFEIPDGVAVIGGFAGTEDANSFDLRDRNLVANEAILSGEIGAPGNADNCFHVVTARDVSGSTILDGFTITGGSADGLTTLKQDMGAGMLVVSGSLRVRWCLFLNNHAGSRGGAVHVVSGMPQFTHCRFVQNQTTVTQAASNMGGAVYVTGTSGQTASADFINCLFTGNRAGVGNGGTGGAVYVADHAWVSLVNCTLVHNIADTLAGGVFGPADLTNSIVWGNRDRNGTTPTAQLRGAIVASHCVVEGGWAGPGNLNENPAFMSALGDDAIAGTLDDNVRLTGESPCLDAGDNARWPVGLEPTDLDGKSRFFGGDGSPGARIDLGAYERQQPCVTDDDCDDGQWCNGLENCVDSVCRYGDAPSCDDHVNCTLDSCDNDSASCVHIPASDLCNNGLNCDGSETCDMVAGCLPGITPDCDDEVDCTIDTCDEAQDVCTHLPDNSLCDDGVFCNGMEQCGAEGCLPGTPPCTEVETCDEATSTCMTADGTCHSDVDCDDGNECTDYHCENGLCLIQFLEGPCSDGNACTSNDVCNDGVCLGTVVPNCNAPGPTEDPPEPPGPNPDDNPVDPPGSDEEVPSEDENPPEDVPPEPPAESPQPCEGVVGCPPAPVTNPNEVEDEDGDGVPDERDDCLDSPLLSLVDARGCSVSDPSAGYGHWGSPQQRRCGACGALGSIGGVLMLCVPGTVLIAGRPRGRKVFGQDS